MYVLIVEDDVALREFLEKGLRLDGHEIAVVADGETALELTAVRRPDLMILDLNLPRKDGLQVLCEMRARFESTAVLVLTARSAMEERVQCLDLGADDIVVKPFSFHELRARCKAIWRRRVQFEQSVLRYGELEMDRARRRVTQAGREVELTTTEFALLESLLRRRGESVCSRGELLREVWRVDETDGGKAMGTNIVEVYINYLRKKLGAGLARVAGRPSVIRTVRGEGYVLQTAEAGA